MPEVRFSVRWPDDSVSQCYSPSTVIHQHLQQGARYPLHDFMARSRSALTEASERVRLKYGYACSSALDQLSRLEQQASRYDRDASVLVETLPL